ncbi:Serine-threonine/tyrosine-protein kinase, catalytic domain [Dillenia turbinata]|uniref:Serine-threonine/tyrosine-protein kinase, catalytic domain n=1 Tax=Dillenia turbinata TaxID=194707 RepID=A0AAN8UWG4_9MAGN
MGISASSAIKFFKDSGTIKGEDREKELTLRNGKLLLEKLKAECDCRSDLFTIFSAKELKDATNDYAEKPYSDVWFGLYKGYLKGRGLPLRVLVKQYVAYDYDIEMAINDVVMASQVNKHKNMLKFLGCCLETNVPALVFEFPEKGTLRDLINNKFSSRPGCSPVSWDNKLRIAREIADAVTYLHHGLPKRILHRDLKPKNIFLDGNFVAKLSGFYWSLSLPKGQDHVEVGRFDGTIGYMPPEIFMTSSYTDRGDVYAFGTLLLEILLEENFLKICEMVEQVRDSLRQSRAQVGGSPPQSPPDLSPRSRRYYTSETAPPQTVTENDALSEVPRADPDEDHLWREVIWPGFMTEKTGANYQQFMACAELALKCRKSNSHQRPTMMEVALELRIIINFQTSTLRK